MLSRTVFLLTAAAPFVFADVEFTTPSPGSTVAGGSTLSVKWKESGQGPAISTFTSYQLFLCAGGNDPTDSSTFLQFPPIVQQGDFSDGNAASGTVQASIGGPDKNAYYLKIISAANGGTVVNYSDRFTLSGMTGSFPASVEAAIKDVSGTQGPAAENNDEAAAASGAPGETGQPYTMQTGTIKYAPMQLQPGTSITAKTVSAQYPTSQVQIAKSYLPTPIQVTTITATNTQSVSTMENTAAPAPAPMDAMQKFLERWKD